MIFLRRGDGMSAADNKFDDTLIYDRNVFPIYHIPMSGYLS